MTNSATPPADLTRMSLVLIDGQRIQAWVPALAAEILLATRPVPQLNPAIQAITALVERAEAGGPAPTVDQLRRALDLPVA